MITIGQQVVMHVPEKIEWLVTDIPGRIRFRFRVNDIARVFFKTEKGIRQFCIGIREDGAWFPVFEHGRNERREGA